MNKFIKNNPLVFWLSIIFTLFALLIYYPSVRLNFLLIDDGQIVKNSRQIVRSVKTMNLENLKPILFEANEGRVRPLYWISQTVLTMLSFDNPSLMHVARVLILILTLVLIIKTMIRLKIDSRWIFFGAFLFVFNFQNFENYYRLGPTEVYLGLYFASFIYFILKKRITTFDYILVALISLFANFTKETFFLTTIPYVLFLLPNKVAEIKTKRKFFLYLITVNLITAALVFAIKFGYGEQVGYSQNYKFTLTAILDHFVNYFKQISFYQSPIVLISIWYLIYWLYQNSKNIFRLDKLADILFLFFVIQAVFNLGILLPWQFVLGRYLINVNISIIFMSAIILNDGLDLILSKAKIKLVSNGQLKNLILLALLPVMFVRNIFPIANFQEWQKTDNELTSDLLKSLSKNIPSNETVWVNYVKGDANIEIYLETSWHLDEFFDRPDIKFSYLDSENLCAKDNDRYILDRSSERLVSKDKIDSNKLTVVDSGSYSYDPVNYGQVVKSFIYGSKHQYWSTSYPFNWQILLQKKGNCIKV